MRKQTSRKRTYLFHRKKKRFKAMHGTICYYNTCIGCLKSLPPSYFTWNTQYMVVFPNSPKKYASGSPISERYRELKLKKKY